MRLINSILALLIGTLLSMGIVLMILIMFLVCVPIVIYVSIKETLKFLLDK